MSDPLLIPEILRIVFDSLDTSSLITVATVCKAWNHVALEVLWQNVRAPTSRSFYHQLRKCGRNIRSLDILLDNTAPSAPSLQLARIVQDTPRLMNLSIGFSDGSTQEALQSVFRVIEDYLAENLRSLSLALKSPMSTVLYKFTSEDAASFFPAFTQLTRLELDTHPADDVLLTVIYCLPGLVKMAFKENPNPIVDLTTFGDDTLRILGQELKNLSDLTIVSNQRLTSAGLVGFASSCKTLTRLDLCHCHQLSHDGLELLVETSPYLTAVALNDTSARDELLHKLATPARAASLRSLSIRRCIDVTTVGVKSIFKCCSSIREFDFSHCPRVSMEVFTGFDWACVQLRTLRFGGIHQRGSQTSDQDLASMYRQLRRITRLEELDMSALPFDLKLFTIGRSTVESMMFLSKLDLTEKRGGIEDKEMIWLASYIPSLRTLRIDAQSTRRQLVDDLREVNILPRIELVRGPLEMFGLLNDAFSDPLEDDSDAMDSDDSDESDDSDILDDTESSEDSEDSNTYLSTESSDSEDTGDSDGSDDSDDSETHEDAQSSEYTDDPEGLDDTEGSDSLEDSDDSEDSDGSSDSSSSTDALSARLQGAWRVADSDPSDSSDSSISDSSASNSSDTESDCSDTSDSNEASCSECDSSMDDTDAESDEDSDGGGGASSMDDTDAENDEDSDGSGSVGSDENSDTDSDSD
ncbi:hypothetical protein B0O80DRAFT_28563 [Mortierella sp. GBAus27b]|nr:hypothetical protein BGX31_000184 [Mortierella sp. GBA43]KAI8356542.1 hypothetical protein B0O80DRAFT_28563 [Mortierella sp. GBAus27b]